MLFFWLILLTVLGAVAALAWWGMGAAASGGRLVAYRRWLLLFDVLSPILLFFGMHLFSWPDWLARPALLLLSGIWMTQLVFGVLAALLRGGQRILARPATPPDLERRRFLQGGGGAAALGGGRRHLRQYGGTKGDRGAGIFRAARGDRSGD